MLKAIDYNFVPWFFLDTLALSDQFVVFPETRLRLVREALRKSNLEHVAFSLITNVNYHGTSHETAFGIGIELKSINVPRKEVFLDEFLKTYALTLDTDKPHEKECYLRVQQFRSEHFE